MKFQDYYQVLGVAKSADADTIKKAYRKLAAKYHPDKNQGNKQAEERFKSINEAHEVLGDPAKRRQYDELGSDWNRQGQGFDFNDSTRQSRGPSDFSDFFEAMFGGGGRGGFQGRGMGAKPGEDYQADIEITLEDAYHGASKLIEVGGKKLKLAVKPGMAEGNTLRLTGKGGVGMHGGADGDFYLKIHVAPHATFERRGHDLYADWPVDFLSAILGGKKEVSTLKGPIKVTLTPKTDSGKVLRLKGMGMPLPDNTEEFGDLYLKVVLTMPKDLTSKELETLKKMAMERAPDEA
jgi:curved DNA-binding protein